MKINTTIYETLTPLQRIISMIDAMGRDDQPEIKKLRETCEKKHYTMNTSEFTDVLDRLFHVSMALEIDLRGFVITIMSTDEEKLKDIYIKKIINYNEAWLRVLKNMGIDKDSMLDTISFRHYSIEHYLNNFVEPAEDRVKEIYEDMMKHMDCSS